MQKSILSVCALMASVAFATPVFAQDGAAPDPTPVQTPTTEPDDPPSDKCHSDFCVRDLFVGVGLGLTHNLGGERTEEIEAVETTDGLFVQIAESQNTDIRVLFETHYLMKGQGIWGDDGVRHIGDVIPALFSCGPFALVRMPEQNRRGCGPFFAVALETDAQVSEFGAGWFIGFGGDEDRPADERNPGFGVGIGLMIDPDSRTIDGRVVDLETMLVRPEFEAAVEAGDIALTTREATTSVMVMISKDF